MGHLHRAGICSFAECHLAGGYQPGRSNEVCFGEHRADERSGHRADSSVERDDRCGAKHCARSQRSQLRRRKRKLRVGDFYPGRGPRDHLRFDYGMHHGAQSHRCAIARHAYGSDCKSWPGRRAFESGAIRCPAFQHFAGHDRGYYFAAGCRRHRYRRGRTHYRCRIVATECGLRGPV